MTVENTDIIKRGNADEQTDVWGKDKEESKCRTDGTSVNSTVVNDNYLSIRSDNGDWFKKHMEKNGVKPVMRLIKT